MAEKIILKQMKRYGAWLFASSINEIDYIKRIIKSYAHNPLELTFHSSLKKNGIFTHSLSDHDIVIIKIGKNINDIKKNFQSFVLFFLLPIFHLHKPMIIIDPHNIFSSFTSRTNLLMNQGYFINKELITSRLIEEQFLHLRNIREISTQELIEKQLPAFSWIKERNSIFKRNGFYGIVVDHEGYLYLGENKEKLILPDWIFPNKENHINYWTSLDFSHKILSVTNFSSQENIDDFQEKAVKYIWGPQIVAAPAGSGKTRTLIHKILHLVTKEKIPQEKILALAFNRKAMLEMKNRLKKYGINKVQIFTLHAFGFSLLRKLFPDWKFQENEKNYSLRALLYQALNHHYHIRLKYDDDFIIQLEEAYRKVKEWLQDPREINLKYEDTTIAFEPIFNTILEIQRRKKLIFYEDMIFFTLRTLLKNHRLRRKIQQKYIFLLVDEFQDLNAAQLLLVRLLALPTNNLTVFGDDDQLIYEWRGAQMENMLEFERYFGFSDKVVLSYNYRSPANIVHLSKNLIHNNKNRIQKEIKVQKIDSFGQVRILCGKNLIEEVQIVHSLIAQMEAQKISSKDIAILTRYHNLALILAMSFRQKNIPFVLADKEAMFTSTVWKDFIAYLTIIAFSERANATMVKRILKRPPKYLKYNQLNQIESLEDLEERILPTLDYWQQEKIEDFLWKLQSLQHLSKTNVNPGLFLREIYNQMNLDKFYQVNDEQLDIGSVSGRLFWKNMIEFASNFTSIQEYYENLLSFADFSREKEGILITTIHHTKGNEYPHVILFHLNDAENSSSPKAFKNREDERRVSYVGITRAMKNLIITFSSDTPSLHIQELFSENSRKLTQKHALTKAIEKKKHSIVKKLKKYPELVDLKKNLERIKSLSELEIFIKKNGFLKQINKEELIELWEQLLYASIIDFL